MAGMVMTVAYDDGYDRTGRRGGLCKIIATFLTDDSAGTASVATEKIVGELRKIVTDPGSVAPSANWDVIVTDEEGADVLANCQNAAALVARHTTTTEQTELYLKNIDATPIGISVYPVVCDKLLISIANAGNSKTGEVIIYYRPL